MGDPFGRVSKGQPFRPAASAWNSFLDAAAAHKRRQHDQEADSNGLAPQASVVLVRNDTGGDVDQFGVLGIAGPLIAPNDNESEFAARVVLSGVTPTESHVGRFVVLIEPAKDDAIVRAVISGVTVALIDLRDETDTRADITPSDASKLRSDHFGAAEILWVADEDEEAEEGDPRLAIVKIGLIGGTLRGRFESETDNYLVVRSWDGTTEGDTDLYVAKASWERGKSIKRFAVNDEVFADWHQMGTGLTGSDSRPIRWLQRVDPWFEFPVLCDVDGGDHGSESTNCTLTYTVKTIDDARTLATGVSPQRARHPRTIYFGGGETRPSPASDTTSRHGTACWVGSTLVLKHVEGEIADDIECET